MSTKTETPEIDLTDDQLEAILKKRKAAKAKKQERERVVYEKNRDTKVLSIVTTAEKMFKELEAFKTFCHIEMESQKEKLDEYGKIRSNSKGGFMVKNTNDTMRVIRVLDTTPTWDERSTKAIELIKDFLGDAIKKKDKDLYEVLMSFLQRNKRGDLEYSRVMDLIQHEEKWDDDRWTEGLRLIKQSFSNHLKGFGYKFQKKDSKGKWQNILLNFSSL